MKKLVFCFSIFANILCFSQVSKNIENLIFEYNNLYEKTSAYSLINEKDADEFVSKIEKLRFEISKNIKKEEIEDIYKGEYGYYAKSLVNSILVERKDTLTMIKLFKETIHSKDKIFDIHKQVLQGKEMGEFLLSAELFENLTLKENSSKIDENSALKEKLLDYIFNSKPINIQLLQNIQFEIPITQRNYVQIKKLVKENGVSELLPVLAKFKKQEDIALIKNFGEKSILAIKYFPDDDFIPFLIDLSENQYNNPDYLSTVSEFCSEKSLKLVEKIFEIQKSKNDKQSIDIFYHYLTHRDPENKECPYFRNYLEKFNQDFIAE